MGTDSGSAFWQIYDDQAAVFEQRAGLDPVFCPRIAQALIEIGELNSGDLVLEIGPGTGQIGSCIGAAACYVGLDSSAGMLDEFRERLRGVPTSERLLVRADAGARWPLVDGIAKLIFSSRALHLLPVEHVVNEVLRVAGRKGATLVIGRVQRDPSSVRSRMAKEMANRLRQHGFEVHRGERQTQNLTEACRERGAEILTPVTIAAWIVSTAPRQSIDSWRTLKGLGGVMVPAPIRSQILDELEEWADGTLGGIDSSLESEESYVLRPIRLPTF